MTKKFPIDGRLAVWDRVRGLTWYNSTFELLNSLTMYEIMGCNAGGCLTLRDGDGEYDWHILADVRYDEDFWLLWGEDSDVEEILYQLDSEGIRAEDYIGKWNAPERLGTRTNGEAIMLRGYWE